MAEKNCLTCRFYRLKDYTYVTCTYTCLVCVLDGTQKCGDECCENYEEEE